ncbi:endonuclease/exonuclease/phosphatase family protein [Saccharothrix sp. ST-888]|uniref:endonuclease/exonuclease/phosphatase family protein n=1 Tax=Saccharothrix sp. ST-888 TaxID=1427391 RepID=UPI0005EC58FB|nr:hypothetical protein [Saccharothrix sp. ST-888]KJK55024.1 hypothetical protein UK12_31255 [Saccharothrix sp. ST-888]
MSSPPTQAPDVATGDDVVKILTWNIKKGEQLDAACDVIAEQDPDVVLWQEMQPGDLEKVTARLGMDGYPAAAPLAARFVADGMLPGASRNDNAILLKSGGPFVKVQAYDHGWAPWHPPANITVRLRASGGSDAESSGILGLVSAHLCYYSAAVREIEADWFSTLAKPGMLTIIGMDRNGYLVGEGPDWDKLQLYPGFDRAHWHNRTLRSDDGDRYADDRTDEGMNELGFVDPCHYARDVLGHPKAVGITAGYAVKGHGGPHAIDGVYGSAALAPLTVRAGVLDTPRLRHISDHLPTEWCLSRSGLWQTMTSQ